MIYSTLLMINRMDISKAKINTAGAYVIVKGLYPFAIGIKPNRGRIPIVRFGGHREPYETGWQCAQREVYEEANIRIRPLATRTTYLADKDQLEAELTEIRWGGPTYQDHIPLLVVADGRTEPASLSLMYLAQADEMPTPSSEIRGLLLLDEAAIHRLCQEPITLGEYLRSGGKAVLRGNFDTHLPLEPFVQLRLLSRILLAQAGTQVA